VLDDLLAEARRRWRLDPADGVAIVPAERLIAVPLEPSRPVLVVPLAVLQTPPPTAAPVPLPGRHGPAGRDPLAVLRRLYPPDHPVGRFGAADETTIRDLAAEDLAAPLYLAPVAPELAAASPWGMPWISDRLRAPDGCPWDREQTHESLRNHLLEEAYEVYDALADGATPELAAELGDLWLQVVLHAQLAAEAGVFDLADVQAAIAGKIVRRHPHVFGDAQVRTATDVNRQWERIKQGERAAAAAASAAAAGDGAAAPRPKSALDGVSRAMPALAASQEMQERAAHLGYDWPSIDGILGKVAEELGELAAAEGSAARAEELGDLLMVVVNLARHHDVEAEAALRAANDKFRRRFGIVERLAAERGVALRDLSFAELDELWDAAKAEIAAAAQAELPATAAQAELPATAAQAELPATAAQAELPATAAQAELPATAAQAELPAAAPARDNGPQEVPR
jgi:MazG family protein